MKSLELMAIGTCSAPWAVSLRAALGQAGRLAALPSLAAALPALGGAGREPELVVLLSQRPDEHCARELLKLRRRAPLARIVNVTGSWCEAEGRSGRPLPGVERVTWQEWPRLLEAYLAARGGLRLEHRPHLWTMPATQSRDEAALLELTLPCPAPVAAKGKPVVAIAAATALAYESLAEACRQAGYAPGWLRRAAPSLLEAPRALVWDAVHLAPAQVAELAEWRRLFPGLPILAIAGFPRPHDVALLRAAGATAVLAKPLSLHGLWWELGQVNGGEKRQTAEKAPLVAAA